MVSADAETFNQEFKNRAQRNIGGLFGESDRNNHTRAIENGRHERDHGRTDEMEHSGYNRHSRNSKASQPIIEIPDDDEDGQDVIQGNNYNHRRGGRGHSSNHNGPIISEVTEEDASSSKRRKGMFGRFFTSEE